MEAAFSEPESEIIKYIFLSRPNVRVDGPIYMQPMPHRFDVLMAFVEQNDGLVNNVRILGLSYENAWGATAPA
jgi:hypothetical protein